MENSTCWHCGIYPTSEPAESSPTGHNICDACLLQPMDESELPEGNLDELQADIRDKAINDTHRAAQLLLSIGKVKEAYAINFANIAHRLMLNGETRKAFDYYHLAARAAYNA